MQKGRPVFFLLQVKTKQGRWLDMPVLPGGVCVNVGQCLEHLSSGRMVATVHRVNTMSIPERRPTATSSPSSSSEPGGGGGGGSKSLSRISCPFFLMPMFGATLEPFPERVVSAAQHSAVQRLSLQPPASARSTPRYPPVPHTHRYTHAHARTLRLFSAPCRSGGSLTHSLHSLTSLTSLTPSLAGWWLADRLAWCGVAGGRRRDPGWRGRRRSGIVPPQRVLLCIRPHDTLQELH